MGRVQDPCPHHLFRWNGRWKRMYFHFLPIVTREWAWEWGHGRTLDTNRCVVFFIISLLNLAFLNSQKFQRGLGIVAHSNSQAQGDPSRSQYHSSTTLLSPLMKDVVPRVMSQTHGHSNDSENLISNHSQNLLPMGMNVGFSAGPSGSIDDHQFIYPQSYADSLSSIVGSQHAHAHIGSPGADATSSRLGSPLVPMPTGAVPGMIERLRQDYPLESQPHHHHRGRNHRNEDVRFDTDTTLHVSQPQFISQRSPFPHPSMVVDQIVTDEHGHGYAKTNGHLDLEHTFDGQTTHSGQQGGIDMYC